MSQIIQRQDLRQTPTLIGRSALATHMRRFNEKASQTDKTVLLRGETGTGKDCMAEIIHHLGRSEQEFVPVDCSIVAESLLETELFGHTRGAFTDAQSAKMGLIQVAQGGTLFFNEIANMSLTLQAKLLRVLEKKSFRPVGAVHEVPVKTRIIAATNADLESEVASGKFRCDLYHRLNELMYFVPPLRERGEDIPVLAGYFLQQESPEKEFTPDAIKVMRDYDWPGNVRELKYAVSRAVFHSEDQNIRPQHVEPYLRGVGFKRSPDPVIVDEDKWLTLEQTEREYLRRALVRTGGNISKAAGLAGVHRPLMYRKIEKFGLKEFVESLKTIF